MGKDEKSRQHENLRLLHKVYAEFEAIDGPAVLVLRKDPHGQMTAMGGPAPIHGRTDQNKLDTAA